MSYSVSYSFHAVIFWMRNRNRILCRRVPERKIKSLNTEVWQMRKPSCKVRMKALRQIYSSRKITPLEMYNPIIAILVETAWPNKNLIC